MQWQRQAKLIFFEKKKSDENLIKRSVTPLRFRLHNWGQCDILIRRSTLALVTLSTFIYDVKSK